MMRLGLLARQLRLTTLLLLMAGCAATGQPDTEQKPAVQEISADDAMRYFQLIRKYSPSELRREYEHVRATFSLENSDFDRLRLAMLLSTPNAPFRDDPVALNLLKDWLKETKPHSGLRAFGSMLVVVIEEGNDKEKRADALQKKLDALKSMEKNLLDREKR